MFKSWDIGRELLSKGRAIATAKAHMPDLVKTACAEGWHQQLIGFVQRRHCRPNAEQVKQMIDDHERIDLALSGMDEGMRRAWKYDDILVKRAALNDALQAPLAARAD
jgi:hypothetical protein